MTSRVSNARLLLVTSGTFIVGAIAWFCSHVASASDEVGKETASLQGEWVLVSGSSFGNPVPTPAPDVRLIFKGREMVEVAKGKQWGKWRFTLDPAKRPKTIDLEIFTTSPKAYTNHAIYELSENRFTLGRSSVAASADRPTAFPNGDGVLFVYERAKPRGR